MPRHLKTVDKFNDQFVSSYLTAGGVKLMMLHDGRNDEALRNFFADVHELYVKASSQLLMNPFYVYDSPIVSPAFDLRVKSLARKYL
ncbi:unnamed protein product [Discosporangium mesarthrocarpum]